MTANESGSTEDMRKYKDQRNLVVKLNIRKKREYFVSIQSKTMENDKQFWKSVKPLFSNVDPTRDSIILIEGDKILSRDEEVSECFNKYFSNITDSLDIAPSFKEVHEDVTVELTVNQMIEKAVEKYKNHPSIRRIGDNCDMANSKFEFTHVLPNEVGKQIDVLNSDKANSGKIPTN